MKRLVTAFSILFAVSSIFAGSVYVNTDSIKGPVCILSDTVRQTASLLSPSKAAYNVIITDGLAQVTLMQTFVNDFGTIDDIAYVFPLPNDASVHAMEFKYHDSIYVARIFEKQQAQNIYDSIVSSGGNAALLLQNRPNVFTQHLANIAYGDTAYIKIRLTMPLKYNNGEFELAIPTMVAERYQSDNASPVSSNGLWNPPANRDGQTLDISVLLQTGFPWQNVYSPTHTIETVESQQIQDRMIEQKCMEPEVPLEMPHHAGVQLKKLTTYPNKDFVLRFSRQQTRDFSVATYFDKQASKGYFFCSVYPDSTLFSSIERPNIDLVLLVDISGSQSGWPLSKEKQIASMLIDRLSPSDKLTLLSFHDVVDWCFDESKSVQATSENITAAHSFINGLYTQGGTQLLNGINAALSIPESSEYERYFVFLTDGFITNETAIFEAIRNHPSHPTVFTFGAGNNLNRYFLEESARIGNGYASVITENEDVELFVNEAWSKLESPQLRDITLSISGVQPEGLLMPLGNRLYKGCPVMAYGTYTFGGNQTVTISGDMNGETVSFSKQIAFASSSNANSMLPQVWARQQIRKLRIEEGTTTVNKEEIIALSIQYQVLSDYTAFLAAQPVSEADYVHYSRINVSGQVLQSNRGNLSKLVKPLSIRVQSRMLTIEAGENEWIQEFMVYDLQGRCVFRMKGSSAFLAKVLWDGRMSNGVLLPGGRYVIKIRTTKGIKARTIMWK